MCINQVPFIDGLCSEFYMNSMIMDYGMDIWALCWMYILYGSMMIQIGPVIPDLVWTYEALLQKTSFAEIFLFQGKKFPNPLRSLLSKESQKKIAHFFSFSGKKKRLHQAWKTIFAIITFSTDKQLHKHAQVLSQTSYEMCLIHWVTFHTSHGFRPKICTRPMESPIWVITKWSMLMKRFGCGSWKQEIANIEFTYTISNGPQLKALDLFTCELIYLPSYMKKKKLIHLPLLI